MERSCSKTFGSPLSRDDAWTFFWLYRNEWVTFEKGRGGGALQTYFLELYV